MFLQESEPRMRGHVAGGNIVVLENADRTIHFEHRQGNLLDAAYPVLAHGARHFVEGNAIASHVPRNQLTSVHQPRGRSLHKFSESPARPPVFTTPIMHSAQ